MLLSAIKIISLLVFGFTCFVCGATLEHQRLAEVFKIDITEINRRRNLQSRGLL